MDYYICNYSLLFFILVLQRMRVECSCYLLFILFDFRLLFPMETLLSFLLLLSIVLLYDILFPSFSIVYIIKYQQGSSISFDFYVVLMVYELIVVWIVFNIISFLSIYFTSHLFYINIYIFPSKLFVCGLFTQCSFTQCLTRALSFVFDLFLRFHPRKTA